VLEPEAAEAGSGLEVDEAVEEEQQEEADELQTVGSRTEAAQFAHDAAAAVAGAAAAAGNLIAEAAAEAAEAAGSALQRASTWRRPRPSQQAGAAGIAAPMGLLPVTVVAAEAAAMDAAAEAAAADAAGAAWPPADDSVLVQAEEGRGSAPGAAPAPKA
jgi:hypothetical protein